MAKQQFMALVEKMGGRDSFIDHINAALDDAGDTETPRLKERSYFNWQNRALPPSVQTIVLAGAAHAGIDADEAVAILPDLAPALAMARKVAA